MRLTKKKLRYNLLHLPADPTPHFQKQLHKQLLAASQQSTSRKENTMKKILLSLASLAGLSMLITFGWLELRSIDQKPAVTPPTATSNPMSSPSSSSATAPNAAGSEMSSLLAEQTFQSVASLEKALGRKLAVPSVALAQAQLLHIKAPQVAEGSNPGIAWLEYGTGNQVLYRLAYYSDPVFKPETGLQAVTLKLAVGKQVPAYLHTPEPIPVLPNSEQAAYGEAANAKQAKRMLFWDLDGHGHTLESYSNFSDEELLKVAQSMGL